MVNGATRSRLRARRSWVVGGAGLLGLGGRASVFGHGVVAGTAGSGTRRDCWLRSAATALLNAHDRKIDSTRGRSANRRGVSDGGAGRGAATGVGTAAKGGTGRGGMG